jgi:purine nucleosidase
MRRILLDTDLAMGAPGSDIDDGFALAFALADPGLGVELITTVNGNTDVDSATQLTLNLLDTLGQAEIPVVKGAGQTLRGASTEPSQQAESGVGTSHAPAAGSAAVSIAERVLAEPGQLTIAAIAPLTNVATALLLEPAVAHCVREIVVMGGAFLRHTNLLRMPGEFNTFTDPDATAVVLRSGAPLRFVGLDVTLKTKLTREHTAAMRGSVSAFARFAADCAEAWMDHLEREYPADPSRHGGCALHDPLAVAAIAHPDLITWHDAHVAVETSSITSRGVMVADLLTSRTPPPKNCSIAVDVDANAFVRLFLDRTSGL